MAADKYPSIFLHQMETIVYYSFTSKQLSLGSKIMLKQLTIHSIINSQRGRSMLKCIKIKVYNFTKYIYKVQSGFSAI